MADAFIRLTARDDTGSAFSSVNRSLESIKLNAASVRTSLAGLGVGLSAGAFVAFTQNVIDGIDKLNDLNDATGASIENISALEDIARRTGATFDTVSTSLIKMNQGLNSAKPGSGTALAIEAIGLSVKDLKQLDPAEAFRRIAVGLSGFADDANKARITQELFGKSLKDVAPLLKDVAEAGGLVGTMTTEQVKAAEEFNKSLFILQKNVTDISRSFLSEMIPSINETIKAFRDGSAAGQGFFETAFSRYKKNVADFYGMNKGPKEYSQRLEEISKQLEDGSIHFARRNALLREQAALQDALNVAVGKAVGGGRGSVNPENVALPSIGDIGDEEARLKALEDARKKASQAAEEFKRELAAEQAILETASGYSANYGQEMNRLAKAYDGGRISLEQLSAAQLYIFQQQPIAKDQAKQQEESAKAIAKAYAEEQKAYEDKLKALNGSASSVADHVQRLQDEEKGAAMAAAQNFSLAVAIEEVGLARVRETYAAEVANNADGQTLLALQNEIESREKLITLLANKEARTANQEAAKKAADEWQKTAEHIESSITDALMRGFESGKDFAANLRDTVVNMFKTMVLRPIVSAIVSPVAGVLTGAMGVSTAANAAGAVNGTAAGVNGASMLSTVGGWFTDFKLSATNTIYEIGGALTKMGAESLGSMVTQNATALGSFVNTAGYALAAVSAIDAASKGQWGSAIGQGVGAWFGGPLGAALGGAVGGWLDSAFGGGHEYTTGTGITGKFSAGTFSGRNYQNWRNDGSSGIFGFGGKAASSGTNYSAMSTAASDQLGQAFASIQFASAAMAVSLGLDAKKVIEFSKDITVALGDNADANKKIITDLLTGVANDIASAVAPDIATFAKSEESASATLARLSTSIIQANAWLSMLRNRLFDVSLAGANAASKLADAFGGLDQLASASKAYYDTYYTNAEKVSSAQDAMTRALKDYGIALPDTKEALRSVIESLDLNTESGRAAYATLVKLAPEFAATADLAAQAAKETAAALIKAFTANGELVPALDATALSLAGVQAGASEVVGAMTQIHTVMGDATSPALTFTGVVGTLSTELTGAQKSSLSLQDQIEALSGASSKAVIDFTGLTDALANANTATFVEVIAQAFDALAARISSTIDAISAERVSVREAALQIINPTALSKQSIQAGIAGINTALPSNAGLIAANNALNAANEAQTKAQDKLTASNSTLINSQDALNSAKSLMATDVAFYQSKVNELYAIANSGGYAVNSVQLSGGAIDMNNTAYRYNAATNRFADYRYNSYNSWGGYNAIDSQRPARLALAAIIDQANPKLVADEAAIAAASDAIARASSDIAAAQADVTQSGAAQAAAAKAAAQALLDYQKALQGFAIDASKSVSKLSNLRVETVKYYEAQKALADLMQTSAGNLLGTVANYRFQQLSPEAQSASLQAQFATSYAMALASQKDGSTLAGYADKLNNTLGPLIDSLTATGQQNLIGNFLAQAETVAKLLQDNAPQNYAADSLTMLSSIDATLAALDASSKSAEQVISDAVMAGSDRTAAGLHAVIAAITGQAVPAFATGAAFSRGGSVVKRPSLFNMGQMAEAGPEAIMPLANINGSLGVRMAGGASDAMVQELRSLRQEVVNLRAESQATAIATGKTAKLLDGVVRGGDSINTVAAA